MVTPWRLSRLRGTSPGVIRMPPRSVPGWRGRATKQCPPCPVCMAMWVSTACSWGWPSKERTWDTNVSTSRCPTVASSYQKMPPWLTQLFLETSHQERQVQPDDHVDSITPGGGRQDTTPPRVASDLVCVLHFISNFYKTEDLFQLCHQHCFPTCAHYVSVTIRDSHNISNSSLLYLVWWPGMPSIAPERCVPMAPTGHFISPPFTFCLCPEDEILKLGQWISYKVH